MTTRKTVYQRIGLIILIVVMGIFFIKPPISQSQSVPKQGPPLEQYLPDNTLMLATFPDLKTARAALKESSLYKLWQEEEMQQLWKTLRANVDPLLGEVENTVGLTIDEIANLFNGEFSIAIIDLPFTRQAQFDFVVALGTDKNKEKIETLLTWFKKEVMAGRRGKVTSITKYQHSNVEIQCFDKKLYQAYLDHTFLLTIQKERMENLIDNYQAKAQKVLSNSVVFQKAKAKIEGAKCAAMLYLNPAEVFKRYAEEMPPEASQFLDNLGLLSIETISASVGFRANGLIKEQIYVNAPADKRKGLMKLLTGQKPCELNLDLIPRDALSYSSTRMDMGKVWTGISNLIKSFAGPEANAEAKLKELEDKLGFSFQNDLYASLDDNYVSYTAFPEAGGIFPDQISITKLNDAAKFEQCLGKMAESINIPIKEIPFKGQVIKCVPPLANLFTGAPGMPGGPDPRMGRMGMMETMMSPLFSTKMFPISFYFIKDNRLYFSENTHSLKRAVIWLEKKRANLGDNPNFKNAASLVSNDSQMVFYTDMERIFNTYYNSLIPLVQIVVKMVSQFTPMMGDSEFGAIMTIVNDISQQMPLGETIGQHFDQIMGSVKYDQTGIKVECFSKTGFVSLIGVPVVGIVAAIAIPNLLSSRVSANEVTAISGLKMLISVEATWYQQDLDGNGKDYWTGDISCFHRARPNNPFIDLALAKADAKPLLKGKEGTIGKLKVAALGETLPKSGYWFRVMRLSPDGTSYQQDPDGDGSAVTNKNNFAFVAYPAEYGVTGRRTFIVSVSGTVFAKDLGPMDFALPEAKEVKITPELEPKIGELISKLGDESSDVREAATSQLIQFGKPVLKYVEAVKKHKDPEVRFRAAVITKRLTKPAVLPIEKWPAGDPQTEGWYGAW